MVSSSLDSISLYSLNDLIMNEIIYLNSVFEYNTACEVETIYPFGKYCQSVEMHAKKI